MRKDCYSLSNLAVNGYDIMAIGASGPEVGRVLSRLLEDVLGGECPNDKDHLLALAREYVED